MRLKYLNASYTQYPGGNSPIIFSWGCAGGTVRTFSLCCRRSRGNGWGAREARKNEGGLGRGEREPSPFPSPQSPSFFVTSLTFDFERR